MKRTEPRVLFTEVSGNRKTGPIPVSTASANTCPLVCPLRGRCYAAFGNLNIHWQRLTREKTAGIVWSEFLLRVRKLHRGQIWRHLQAGDLEGDGKRIDAKRLAELTDANRGRKGFGYTHHNVLAGKDGEHNRKAIAAANAGGLTINLSGNNVEHADKLAALKIAPVVTILPSDSPHSFTTPAGNKVIACPAQTRENVTCASCRLCSISNRRLGCNGGKALIVGFLAHGNGVKYANTIANRGKPQSA